MNNAYHTSSQTFLELTTKMRSDWVEKEHNSELKKTSSIEHTRALENYHMQRESDYSVIVMAVKPAFWPICASYVLLVVLFLSSVFVFCGKFK